MGTDDKSDDQLPLVPTRCSFCDKSQELVQRLIAGPRGVAICDECVGLCAEILEEERLGHPPNGVLPQ